MSFPQIAFRSLALFLCLTVTAMAQTLPRAAAPQPGLPAQISKHLNDFAGLLDADTAARIDTRLAELRIKTGVQTTVVTLGSRHDYGDHANLEIFATRLFNHWGVGGPTRNDGIMLLILTQDRAARIELGADFGRSWDQKAQRVMDRNILPPLRSQDYANGILSGINGIEHQIITPYKSGKGSDNFADQIGPFLVIFAIAALFVGHSLWGWLGHMIRRCPQCGTRGSLRIRRETLVAPTRATLGSGVEHTQCTACNYHDERSYMIPNSGSGGRSGGFGGGGSSGGGGTSGGGGASGRF